MKLVIVLPTYNEAENLAPITAELLALDLENFSILVVDDNSPDGTGNVADDLADLHPGQFFVLHRTGQAGLGLSYLDGFNKALEMGADFIVQMDADFSHSPHYILDFLNTIPQADIVVGSRYIKGGQLDQHWSWWRRFLSWWANAIYTRLILGLHVRDGTAGFKMWRRNALEGINFDTIQSNGYVFQVEMAYVSEKLGFQIVEVPIYFEDRRIGRSKMSVPVKIEAALRTWQIRWRHRGLKPEDRRSLAHAAQ